MKSYCKNIDISDTDFIEKAIWNCLSNRDRGDYHRQDIQRVIKEYGTIDKMAAQMSHDIKCRQLNLPPVIPDKRIDRCNGKLREITIEDIWQQFYDYVAANGLEPSLARLGYYQCGCVVGKGQIWGIQMLHGFLQKTRYVLHCDIKKCYPSIPQDKLFAFLAKFVRNEPLLWLIRELVTHTTEKGISIGSRLSITLCQLYLSQVYHHMEGLHKTRRGKSRPLIDKILIFMDDIYITGNSISDLHKAKTELMRYCEKELSLSIKENWIVVDGINATVDAMGFRLNKDYTKMRRINYLRTKRSMDRFIKKPNMKTAQTLVSRTTNVKYSDSYHFRKKYQWKKISKKARRIISHESKVLNATAGGCNNDRWQYSLLPDSDKRRTGGSSGSGNTGDAH
jgi:hypothetical protein